MLSEIKYKAFETPFELNDGGKPYDLEERTYLFAKEVREFLRNIDRSIYSDNDLRQVIRSSGSVGANYIEANENLGKKDALLHLRIARKEAKESNYWLKLINEFEHSEVIGALQQEAQELMKILSSTIQKLE